MPVLFLTSRRELELVLGPKAEIGNQLSRELGVKALNIKVEVPSFTGWVTLGSFEP